MTIKYLIDENKQDSFYGTNFVKTDDFIPFSAANLRVSESSHSVEENIFDHIMDSMKDEQERQYRDHKQFLDSGMKAIEKEDELIILFIRRTVAQLNVSGYNNVGSKMVVKEELSQCGIIPEHHYYFARMLSILSEEGFLEEISTKDKSISLLESSYKVKKPIYDNTIDSEIEKIESILFKDYYETRTITLMICRCGDVLPELLRGRKNAIDLLFSDNLITSMYRDSPQFQMFSLLVASAIKQTADRKKGPVSILEVGAGTGGTSAYILPQLDPKQTRYVYTDLSLTLIRKAKTQFENLYPFVEYKALNIEDVQKSDELFDIIIESNCYHAVGNLGKVLENSRKLLKPNGLLVMMEVAQSLFSEFVFGLTGGWWSFTEDDNFDNGLRKGANSPSLQVKEWYHLFNTHGFSEYRSFGYPNTSWDGKQDILIAMASESVGEVRKNEPKTKNVVLWFGNDDDETTSQIRESLHNSGAITHQIPQEMKYDHKALKEFVLSTLNSYDPSFSIKIFYTVPLETEPLISKKSSNDLIETQQRLLKPLHELNKALFEIGTDSSIHMPELFIATKNIYSPYNTCFGSVVDPLGAAVVGFMRVFSSELSNLSITLVDCSLTKKSIPIESDNLTSLLLEKAVKPGCREYCIRYHNRFQIQISNYNQLSAIPYLTQTIHKSNKCYYSKKRIENENYINLPLNNYEEIPHGYVRVKVIATGVNFRDVLLERGMLAMESTRNTLYEDDLGLEFAGLVEEVSGENIDVKIGDRVMGFARGSIASHVLTPAEFVCKIPDSLSFEEASTIPLAYSTAYYALHNLGHIQPGDKVLIHAAAGGVGFAAINLCRHFGAVPIGTAGKDYKRRFLKYHCEEVYHSRSLSFVKELRKNYPDGVDIVLNSLSGKFIQAGIDCLAPGGRFIEIGKQDIYANNAIKLLPFQNNISFNALTIDRLMITSPQLVKRCLREVVDLFDSPETLLKPLPMHMIHYPEYKKAFDFMAEAGHIGKIVLTRSFTEENNHELIPPALNSRFEGFKKDAAYLIIGGTGGFGLSMAEFMAKNGAGAVILTSRSGGNDTTLDKINEIKESTGVSIVVQKADWSGDTDTLQKSVETVLNQLQLPLKGLVNMAMILNDQFIRKLEWKNIEITLQSKIITCWNAYKLIQNMQIASELEFFLLTSSINTHLAPQGQSSYAAGNLFLEAFANYARMDAEAIPAFCINLPVIEDVGYVNRTESVKKLLSLQGFISKTSEELCSWIFNEWIPMQISSNAGFYELDWKSFFENVPGITGQSRLSKQYEKIMTQSQGEEDLGDSLTERLEATFTSKGKDEAKQLIIKELTESLASILSLSVDQMTSLKDESMLSAGLDSMMSIELKRWVDVNFHTNIPVVNIVRGPSIIQFSDELFELLMKDKNLKTISPDISDNETEKIEQSVESDKNEEIKEKTIDKVLEKSDFFVESSYDIVRMIELKKKYPAVQLNDVPDAEKLTLFIFPYHQGTEKQFDGWADQLPSFVVPVCVVVPKLTDYPGVYEASESIVPHLNKYIKENNVQKYAMFGHSVGSYLAYMSSSIMAKMKAPLMPLGLSLGAVPAPHDVFLPDVAPSLPARFLLESSVSIDELLATPVPVKVLQLLYGTEESFGGTKERVMRWKEICSDMQHTLIEPIEAWHYFVTSKKEQVIERIVTFVNLCRENS